MARVLVLIEVEMVGTEADALEAVDSLLDGGLPQDCINENGEYELRVMSAVVRPAANPEIAFRDYAHRYLTGNGRHAGLE